MAMTLASELRRNKSQYFYCYNLKKAGTQGRLPENWLESTVVVCNPSGFRLKGSADGVVCVQGAGENRYAVAFERHVRNRFGAEHVDGIVQRLDGHVHRLLVGGKKKIDV